MKKILALLLASLMILAFVAACNGGDTPDTPPAGNGDGPPAGNGDAPAATEFVYPTGPRGEGVEIVIYGWNDELATAMERYKELNPDFLYTLVPVTHFTDWDGSYEIGLNEALLANGVDVYFVEQAFVVNYTQFDFEHYALPYSELLGVDVTPLIAAAEIPPFIVDAGTNSKGEVVGLGFQHTGSGFIYRRDLAEQIWGDGSLDFVSGKIGAASGNWDAFLAAAAEADEAGISILSDMEDAWGPIRQSPNPWIVNDKLEIDARRLSFLDIGKALYQGGFVNMGGTWDAPWFNDMSGSGVRPVLGFLGPAWLINYVLVNNAGDTVTRDDDDNIIDGVWGLVHAPVPFAWGGTWSVVNKNSSPEVHAGLAELIYWITLDTTDTGFQYQFGGATLYDGSAIDYFLAKDMMASAVVQRRLDSTLEFLGGQDMAPVFLEAGLTFDSRGWGPYDRGLNGQFNDQAMAYWQGDATRDEMLDSFRQWVSDELGFGS